jgi:hypothetical protein
MENKVPDRQCGTYPIHAAATGLVRIALPPFTAVGLMKNAPCLTGNPLSEDGSTLLGAGTCRFQQLSSSARLTVVQCDQTIVEAALTITCR